MLDTAAAPRLALGERLAEVRELRDAGQRPGPVRDALAAAGGDVLDPFLHAEGGLLAEPAVGLDPAELGPPGDGEVVGELLHRVGPAGGVGDRGDVGLLDEQRRGVAGDPATEGVRKAQRFVEGDHRDGVGTADTGREGGDGAAQHVDPRIDPAHHRAAGDDVLALRGLRCSGGVEHPCPQPAGRAQLGDRRELLVGRGVAELDERGGLVHRETGLGEHAEVVHADGHRPAELLGVAGPAIVQRGPVDDRAQDAEALGPADGVDEGLVDRAAAVRDPLAEHQRRGRVGRQVAARVRVAGGVLEQPGQRLGLLGARPLQADRCQVEQHALQRDGQVGAGLEVEVQRGRAVVEVGQGCLVDGPGVLAGQRRTDVPGTGARRAGRSWSGRPGRPAGRWVPPRSRRGWCASARPTRRSRGRRRGAAAPCAAPPRSRLPRRSRRRCRRHRPAAACPRLAAGPRARPVHRRGHRQHRSWGAQ